MANNIFEKILIEGIRKGQMPARNKASREWFRQRALKVSKGHTDTSIISEVKSKRATVVSGRMYYFRYNPKWKKKLPYYDTFPLIFMVGPAPDGFYGINVHYLAPPLRAKLMDALYSLKSDKRYDENTKLEISYAIMKKASKFRFFKPCFKHYLKQYVKTKFVEIPATEWDIALMLPNAKFQKATETEVWEDSARASRK